MRAYRDGWEFERLENGDVHVRKVDAGGAVAAEVTVPATEWGCFVAAVSGSGKTPDTYFDAMSLHMGPLIDWPIDPPDVCPK